MKKSYKKSEQIQALLLDTAEALFAEHGYYGVSVRDITEAAEVRSASINYHFASKENLFAEIVKRRVKPLSEARLNLLAEVSLNPKQPETTVGAIVDAFARPMFDFASKGGPGWKNYCILTAQMAVQKNTASNQISALYDKLALEFIAALQKTFPKLDEYRIHACFQFMLSNTLYIVSENQRMDRLSQGRFKSSDIDAITEPFMVYVTKGLLGVAESR